MRQNRFTEEQILGLLKEHEAGASVAELFRRHGISEQTLYRRKQKYGGMSISEARRLKALEDENTQLKWLIAEHALDNQMLKDLLRKIRASIVRASQTRILARVLIRALTSW